MTANQAKLDSFKLVSRIMNEHPQTNVDEVCRRVREALNGPDAKYQDAFIDYTTRKMMDLLEDQHDRA
jgi:hypothetical protein